MRRFLALLTGTALALVSPAAMARPVSMYVVDADVRMVLASVAELGGVSLVLDDSVQGTITIRLDEVEPEEAFALIAAADDLSLSEAGGVTIITAKGVEYINLEDNARKIVHELLGNEQWDTRCSC